jgi:putative transposase
MSCDERLETVERAHPQLSIVKQCALLKVSRSTLYHEPKPESAANLALMRRIDELYMKWPFYGARRMAEQLRREGVCVDRKRVRRLMRLMGIEAIYPKPNTSRSHPGHKKYAYLLKNMAITRVNQVWCADITYIEMARGFVYLVAIMDWFSRRVLAWRLSITMETDFCVEALQEAMSKYGKPEIFNTDQGVQFTAASFIETLATQGVRISMDGKGRYLDNIFIERLWRSLKYEDIYIKAYDSVAEARLGIGAWLTFYNDERLHQALAYKTPREFFEANKPVDMMDNASALPTSPQAQQQQQERSLSQTGKRLISETLPLAA